MRKRIAIQAAVLIAVLAAPLVLMAVPRAVVFSGPTLCIFKFTIGWDCPGCGMTRAASHLIRGNVDLAIGYHPLIPMIALQAAAAWVWFMLRRVGKVKQMSSRTLNYMLIGTAISLVAVWVLRMALGSLPPV